MYKMHKMRTKKDFDHQNEYNKQTYDRIGLMIPKGQKELWQTIAKGRSMSLNAFIIDCVKKCTVDAKTVQFSENDEKP